MTSTILNKAGKKLFEQHMEKYAPTDPLYEFYFDDKGKKKRRKRELPPGLSQRDARILRSVNKRAHYLDKGFSICGLRFGWTFIIGIIPGAGDIANIALAYMLVVRKARRAEIPAWLLRRILLNNVISGMVGLVPFAGDVFVGAFKANSRNAALLEEFLRIRGEEYIKIKAEGKDPEVVAKPSKKEGAVNEKVDGKKKEVAKGVTKSDAEQIKPGAGLKSGEVVPGTMPGGSEIVSEGAQALIAQGSRVVDASSNGGVKKKKTSFSAGSIFGKKNSVPVPDPQPATEGTKFVENVEGGTGTSSKRASNGGGGTLKKKKQS